MFVNIDLQLLMNHVVFWFQPLHKKGIGYPAINNDRQLSASMTNDNASLKVKSLRTSSVDRDHLQVEGSTSFCNEQPAVYHAKRPYGLP